MFVLWSKLAFVASQAYSNCRCTLASLSCSRGDSSPSRGTLGRLAYLAASVSSGAVALGLRFLRSPFKPYVRISRIRLTDGLLMQHARLQDSIPVSTLLTERHSARSGRRAHGNVAPDCAWPRCTACAGVLALYLGGIWVLRPCPRAYLLTLNSSTTRSERITPPWDRHSSSQCKSDA